MTTQEIQQLRQRSSDDAVFNNLLKSDPEFQQKVERVQKAYPDMSPFEKAKFPSAMLDIHTKSIKTAPKGAGEENANSLNRGMTEEMRPKGAWDTLTQDPLVFAGQTAKNILPSTGRLIGGLASALYPPNLPQTGKTLLQLGVGGAANTLESIADLAGVKNAEEIFDLESEEVASAVGDFYVERYGSLEQAATTLRDDPAGFFSDLGAVVTGVGGALKGGATAVGASTGAATKTSTALTGLGRGVRATQGVGSTLIRKGINMEPIVIVGKGVVIAGRGVRNAARATGRSLQPSALTTKGLKMNPSDIRKFQNLQGNELPGEFLIRKGVLSGGDEIATLDQGVKLTGKSPVGRTRIGIMDDLEKIARKAKSTVDNELAGTKQAYGLLDDVPDDALKLINELEAHALKFDDAELLAFTKRLIKKERVTLSDLNELKRHGYKTFRTYNRSNVASDAGKAQQINRYERTVRSFIENEAQRKGLPDIAILNEDIQKSFDILDSMHKSDAAFWSKGKLTVGLMDGLFGFGALAVTGDAFTSAGIVIGRHVLESTVFRTTMAKYLSKLDPSKVKILQGAIKSGKHTKGSRSILRRVVAQTADDIRNQRIGDAEAIPPQTTSRLGQENRVLQGSQTSATSIPQSENRLAGLKGVQKGVDDVPTKGGKIAGIPDELQPLVKEARKYDDPIEFVSTLRRMKTSEASPEIIKALKTMKEGKNITSALESLWKKATGYVEPILKKGTPIEGTNLNIEDLPF